MSTTKIVGYFNPNRWPLVVNISAVNLNVTIPPKGYVIDRENKKVNDPLLEKFVGADMLAREHSKVEVPLNLFPRPQPVASGAHNNGVGASTEVIKDSRGRVQDSSFDGVLARHTGVPANVTAPSHAVATYTPEEAVKKGIFRPVIIPDDSNAPKETDGHPVRGDNLPPIMTARDATPGEAKKLAESGVIRVEATVEVKKNQVPVAVDVDGEVEEAQEAIDVAGGPTLDVGAHLKMLHAQLEQPSATAPIVAPAIPATPLPIVKAPSKPDAFVCAADGRSFKRRGYLLSHVKKHFSDREKELMAPYADEAEE